MAITANQAVAVANLADTAVEIERAAGIPASFTLAQSVLESGWAKLEKGLGAFPGNNCLGIKTYPGCFGEQLLETREWFTDQEKADWLAGKVGRKIVRETGKKRERSHGRYIGKTEKEYYVLDWFATFETLARCFDKRTELLSQGKLYKPALDRFRKDSDFVAYVAAVSRHYATEPTYAEAIHRVLKNKDLQTALASARSKGIS